MELTYQAILDDCLIAMDEIKDHSVDMILCDLPYGTTSCKWDTIIPLDILWNHYKRILKSDGVAVLTASQPFTTVLGYSNLEWLKYEWIWEKDRGSNFASVKYQPMKEHENVLVFAGGKTKYNPQMQERAESGKQRVKTVINYSTSTECLGGNLLEKPGNILPEMRGPRSIQKFNRDRGLHPTQKPLLLFEYLIKTYTNEGDLVLDNCAGSFTTAVACDNLKRSWICIEKDFKYFSSGVERVNENRQKLNLPKVELNLWS